MSTSRYQNKELIAKITELWNNGKKASEIAEDETIKSLWKGKQQPNANAIGCFIAELRRTYNIPLTYKGSKWQKDRHESSRNRNKSYSSKQQKPNDVHKLLQIGAALTGESDPQKYLLKILVEAVNKDFREMA